MTIGQAVEALENGENVARIQWGDIDLYLSLKEIDGINIIVSISQGYAVVSIYNPSQHDVLANDWIIVGDGK